ncbi:hypothetical protein K458DRAFT_394790 [Lentithecium fluviatile CBS 122367]|uniref:Uncharacterized protein n=1 Tax=Lentithecium fluviatile CBS 122367 TaxID=1168545 RepID=A0A6G1IJV3_9PLEO|nr:hypothetical protein K458DRAFT_394790 [Lentithecium fluviatile CBS 122367]
MPHKHKRKADNDDSNFDLPPTARATPLPVGKARALNPAPRNKKRKSGHIEGYGTDDTPKAFARLMVLKATGKQRSGLDDGMRKKTKKPIRTPQEQQNAAVEQGKEESVNSEAHPTKEDLKIMPGESLSDFRQRVAQALPLTGVAKSSKKIAGMSDHRVTKHERKLKRLQAGWRAEEARIRDKEAEARELAEEDEDEEAAMWEDKTSDLPEPSRANGKRSRKKGKKRLVVGEVDDGRNDEWEELRHKREERKGLHDVVQEPPSFSKVPREVFKVKNGAKVNVGNVPNKVGSLRKREELGAERQGIIETYRKLMAAKREG